jgi:hypothetical protein
MNATEIDNIGQSTRIDTHKYQCERCVFNQSYMYELIILVCGKCEKAKLTKRCFVAHIGFIHQRFESHLVSSSEYT